MLKLLTIRNFAVIEAVVLEVQDGLNLLTGETGSGKSIIVDALGLLLGDRGALSQIRTGEKSAFVEGIFEVTGDDALAAGTVLDESGIEFETGDELVIRREVLSTGKVRIFLNDRTVSVATLRRLQPLLVEIHGQGEQKLLRSSRAQLDLLDAFAGAQNLRKQAGEAYSAWKNSLEELLALRDQASERIRNLELIQHQISEIDAVGPQLNEDEELARDRVVMANAEKILERCGGAYNELYESDNSILASVGGIVRRLREISELDSRVSPIVGGLEEGSLLISEAANSLRSYVDGIEFSPEEFTAIDNRLTEIERLKRKFGGTIADVLQLRETLNEKLEALNDVTSREELLEETLLRARKSYADRASKLTILRKAASSKLERAVIKELKHVALQDAQMSIKLETAPAGEGTDNVENDFFTPYGADQIKLLFSANPGESLKPLSQVASGGELSRLMLALLTASFKNAGDTVSGGTVIFDEIDAGIGGGVAEAVGRRLKMMANHSQVLCVTHQAQIARFADAHFLVKKEIVKGRTVATVELLDEEARVKEVARMIAGDQEAKTTIETARWMLESAGA